MAQQPQQRVPHNPGNLLKPREAIGMMQPDENERVHRKRLAQILRYIASMHQSLNHQTSAAGEDEGSPLSFVLQTRRPKHQYADFFQRQTADAMEAAGRVLFSTNDFRQLLALERSHPSTQQAPFTFYAASGRSNNSNRRKRATLAGTIKQSILSPSSSPADDNGKACWLRMTRLTNAQLGPRIHYEHLPFSVRTYLRDWLLGGGKQHTNNNNSDPLDRLTLRRLERAPKPAPADARAASDIKRFLRQHKKYLVQKSRQQQLEPIYNQLFEWIQMSDHQLELVWGLGHARLCVQTDDHNDDYLLINGPLFEVHMEVELVRDGALLVRPRDHTGVTLNRQVVTALAAYASSAGTLSQLHQMVAELEPSQISPGQPNTYIPLLKRVAMLLSPGGSFQLSSSSSSLQTAADQTKLVVTEAWCLFARPKPSSVWARDALAFADAIQQQQQDGGSPVVLPMAAWSLTHGPATLEKLTWRAGKSNDRASVVIQNWVNTKLLGISKQEPEEPPKPLFPLPISAAQNQLADLLLNQNYPAVVCEGPPGTGKTHSIANLICAYLCQGKRVLVTSKNAPALSVLRNRLPESVRELCVDVSMSELSGMRQLQQTVERLADRICSVSSVVETEKCRYLQRNIADLEQELVSIDEQLIQRIAKIRQIVGQPRGKRLIDLSLQLSETAPWMTKQLPKWTVKEVALLRNRVASLVVGAGDTLHQVSGYEKPVADALISKVASEAGSALSVVKNAAEAAVASIPVVGPMSGLQNHLSTVQDMLSNLRINSAAPASKADWGIVLRALKHAKAVSRFEEEVWKPFERKGEWPRRNFCENPAELADLHAVLVCASEARELAWMLNMGAEVKAATEARTLDTRRGAIVSRMHSLAEELVDCTVVMELSKSFSVEAQSALIRFAQIAGKAKFSRTSQPSKMTQRQRRRRQEYLAAFDRCCRFIPCWIMTTSQISDYLPSECLFDLVICDESSQSEAVSVLPGMLRGKQWLIVGDTKQVSPTGCFVSEDQVESLKASLPPSPFSGSLLPGESFFDLCAQAFPKGRVVLSEHFRCAEEIIAFSNEQFYDNRLVPLRLPRKSERLNPAVLDVKVQNGEKVGKVNEKEADEIVKRIEDLVATGSAERHPRSIGVISLIGDEQSRLIRGRLLDTIGAQLFARHDVLVGDPPTFQGAERDIIYLSMVASPGNVPTQSQLMHFQRTNVALSRARDQCVLVRSIDLKDIPSLDDAKIPVLEFFEGREEDTDLYIDPDSAPRTCVVRDQLLKSLEGRGFTVRGMGVVWKNGLCVEQAEGDNRAALMVEGVGETEQQWHLTFSQQKAIERVGWRCLRVDGLSLLTDFDNTFEQVLKFLVVCGIEEPAMLYDALDSDQEEEPAEDASQGEVQLNPNREDNGGDEDGSAERQFPAPDVEVVVVSSNDEEDGTGAEDSVRPDLAPSGPLDDSRNDDMDASNFGQVVDLGFLQAASMDSEPFDAPNDAPAVARRPVDTGKEYQADDSDSFVDESGRERKRQKRTSRRTDKYQRDGRWFPGRQRASLKNDDPDGRENDWYDTDSDLSEERVQEKLRTVGHSRSLT